jgi:GTP cyclohydrolase I
MAKGTEPSVERSRDLGSVAGELSESDGAPAPPQADLPRIERAVREILAAVGEDPNREGLRETPARVARMYAELFCGLHDEPRVHLRKFFTEKYDEMVLVRDISFNSMCEHQLLPFTGVAHIGYITIHSERESRWVEQAGARGRKRIAPAAGTRADDGRNRQSAD